MKENCQENYDCDSVASESTSETSEETFTPSMELNESNTYPSEEVFVFAVRTYAKQQGFQVHLGKFERNFAGQIRKRTIVCSREGSSNKTLNGSNKRNRTSQRCNCQFVVRASLNLSNGLWYVIFLHPSIFIYVRNYFYYTTSLFF